MKIDVITLFPRMLEGPLDESILKRAQEKKLVSIAVHQLRDYAEGKHRVTDDRPFGGGPGMVMKPEPIVAAVENLKTPEAHVILMTPQGKQLNQEVLQKLSTHKHLIIVCGHYEGVDDRARELVVNEEISIGDYVLTNGALPAAVLIDGISRLLLGVLGHEESASDESFSQGLLEYPQYTRPAEFRGLKVPDILVSGNHQQIEAWRREMSKKKTKEQRPDLLSGEK